MWLVCKYMWIYAKGSRSFFCRCEPRRNANTSTVTRIFKACDVHQSCLLLNVKTKLTIPKEIYIQYNVLVIETHTTYITLTSFWITNKWRLKADGCICNHYANNIVRVTCPLQIRSTKKFEQCWCVSLLVFSRFEY